MVATTEPPVVVTTTWLASPSVIHILPSGPVVTPTVLVRAPGRVYSVTVPPGVIFPTRWSSALSSVNHTLPSGPGASNPGRCPGVSGCWGTGYRVILVPSGVILSSVPGELP